LTLLSLQFDDGGYVELLALRPIWVGWKQAKAVVNGELFL